MNLKITALAAGLILAMPLSAQANDVETRLANQEQRLNLLEQKMDKLLDLMISQTQGGASAAPQVGSPVAAAAPARTQQPQAAGAAYKPGLILDIYQVERPDHGNTFPVEQKSNEHFSIGRILHEGAAQFSLGQFLNKKELAPLANVTTNKLVAQEFHGAVQITKSGAHVVGLELKRESDSDSGKCVQTMQFDGQDLLSIQSDRNPDFKVANTQLQLEPGIYDFSIWQVCGHRGGANDMRFELDPNKVTAALKIKAPGDWEASLVPAERLFHLQ